MQQGMTSSSACLLSSSALSSTSVHMCYKNVMSLMSFIFLLMLMMYIPSTDSYNRVQPSLLRLSPTSLAITDANRNALAAGGLNGKSNFHPNGNFRQNYFRQLFLRAVMTPDAQASSTPSESTSPRYTSGSGVSQRIKRIKDTYLTREIVNDVTACEFALIVDMKTNKAKIDYSMLISKLDKDSVLLAQRNIEGDKQLNNRLIELKVALQKKIERNDSIMSDSDMQYVTGSGTNEGAGRADELTSSTIKNRKFTEAVEPEQNLMASTAAAVGAASTSGVLMDDGSGSVNTTELNIPALRVSVREDGTVDWEDTIASGTEVAKFGTQLWERLNGKEETAEGMSIMELLKPVPAKMVMTPGKCFMHIYTDTYNCSHIHIHSFVDEHLHALGQISRDWKGSSIQPRSLWTI